jgi:hypothetical protein
MTGNEMDLTEYDREMDDEEDQVHDVETTAHLEFEGRWDTLR